MRRTRSSAIARVVGDLADPLEGFAAWQTAGSCSTRTIYERDRILRFMARINGIDHPVNATPADVTTMLSRPVSQGTRYAYWSAMKQFYGWAMRSGIVTTDPTVLSRRPKIPHRDARPLKPSQVQLLLDAEFTHNVRAWITLGLFQGLRTVEMARMRGEHVRDGWLDVIGKGGRFDTVPAHAAVIELAAEFPAEGWWFVSPRDARDHMTEQSVSAAVARAMRKAGVDATAHQLRHTFISGVWRSTRDALVTRQAARHASWATTEGYVALDRPALAAGMAGLTYGRRESA